jgi:hypothetical protein
MLEKGLFLGDFDYSSSSRLILPAYNPFHTVTVQTLVKSITISEEFSQHHGFCAARAFEGSAASFVN